MNERDRILALTQIAFLNAIILSILSIQFVVPVAFLLFLWLIPAIFALEVYHAPLTLTLLSGLLIVALSFALFGVDIGLWATVYVSAGSVLGTGRRLQYHWSARFMSTGITLALSILAVTAVFAWFAQVGWQEIIGVLQELELYNHVPLIPIMVVGLIAWTVILSVAIDWFLSRVLRQIHVQEGH